MRINSGQQCVNSTPKKDHCYNNIHSWHHGKYAMPKLRRNRLWYSILYRISSKLGGVYSAFLFNFWALSNCSLNLSAFSLLAKRMAKVWASGSPSEISEATL